MTTNQSESQNNIYFGPSYGNWKHNAMMDPVKHREEQDRIRSQKISEFREHHDPNRYYTTEDYSDFISGLSWTDLHHRQALREQDTLRSQFEMDSDTWQNECHQQDENYLKSRNLIRLPSYQLLGLENIDNPWKIKLSQEQDAFSEQDFSDYSDEHGDRHIDENDDECY